jgi:predicted transcriptional regulator
MGIQDETLKRIRAQQMIEAKVSKGMTNAEIAKDFGVHERTVERTLSWAKKADLFIQYEDRLMSELLPLAHETLRTALGPNGDPKVALKIYEGTNILKKDHPKTAAVVKEEDDLASYINRKRLEAAEHDIAAEGQLITAATTKLIAEADVSGEPREASASASSGSDRSKGRFQTISELE